MVIKFNKLVHIVYMILYSKLDITGVYGTCWKFVYLGAVGVKMMADPIILGYPGIWPYNNIEIELELHRKQGRENW